MASRYLGDFSLPYSLTDMFGVISEFFFGEGSGTPLQYSCLENPMDGGAWWAAVHGVAKSWTRLSDFTFTFMHWRRKWQPTPVFLPGESQGLGGTWWAAIYGVAQSQTWLKWLSSSSEFSLPSSPTDCFLHRGCLHLVLPVSQLLEVFRRSEVPWEFSLGSSLRVLWVFNSLMVLWNNIYFLFKNFFTLNMIGLQCCVNLCCTAKWLSYTHIYIIFYVLFHYWFITGYWT